MWYIRKSASGDKYFLDDSIDGDEEQWGIVATGIAPAILGFVALFVFGGGVLDKPTWAFLYWPAIAVALAVATYSEKMGAFWRGILLLELLLLPCWWFGLLNMAIFFVAGK